MAGIFPFLTSIKPFLTRDPGETTSPSLKARSIEDRLITIFASVIGVFILTPRPRSFGIFLIRSRSSGRFLRPARAFWPFVPFPEVLPRCPPRPICWDFLFLWTGLSVCICMIFILFYQRPALLLVDRSLIIAGERELPLWLYSIYFLKENAVSLRHPLHQQGRERCALLILRRDPCP